MADLRKTPHWDGPRDEQLKSYHEDMKTVKGPMEIKDIRGGTGFVCKAQGSPFPLCQQPYIWGLFVLFYYMFYMRQDVDVLI